jgi:hypothetical protein
MTISGLAPRVMWTSVKGIASFDTALRACSG